MCSSAHKTPSHTVDKFRLETLGDETLDEEYIERRSDDMKIDDLIQLGTEYLERSSVRNTCPDARRVVRDSRMPLD